MLGIISYFLLAVCRRQTDWRIRLCGKDEACGLDNGIAGDFADIRRKRVHGAEADLQAVNGGNGMCNYPISNIQYPLFNDGNCKTHFFIDSFGECILHFTFYILHCITIFVHCFIYKWENKKIIQCNAKCEMQNVKYNMTMLQWRNRFCNYFYIYCGSGRCHADYITLFHWTCRN